MPGDKKAAHPGRAEPAWSPAQRGEQGPRPVIHGPGVWFFALPILYIGFGVLELSLGIEPYEPYGLLAIALIVIGVVWPPIVWARYRLDEEGLQVRTLSRRRAWRWRNLGHIQGTTVAHGANEQSVRQGTRHEVYDREGRRLFRVSPWTERRTQLVAEIRRRIAASRRSASR